MLRRIRNYIETNVHVRLLVLDFFKNFTHYDIKEDQILTYTYKKS